MRVVAMKPKHQVHRALKIPEDASPTAPKYAAHPTAPASTPQPRLPIVHLLTALRDYFLDFVRACSRPTEVHLGKGP